MYKPKNIKLNVIARTLVGVVELVFSLFTFPLVARILGPTAIGQIDYVTAAVSYFVILAGFGIDQFGGREIAQNRNDGEKVSDIMSRLMGLRIILGLGLFLVYIILVVPYYGERSTLFYASSLMILSSIFSIIWALDVLEDFSYIACTRFITKLGFLVYLLMYVKTPDDALKYFISLIFCDFAYYMFAFLRLKFTYKVKFSLKKMMALLTKAEYLHLSRIFFIGLIQSFMGGITSLIMGKANFFHELGLLSTAQRFFWIGYYIIAHITIVLQTRSMSFADTQNSEDRDLHLDRSIGALFLISFPIGLGLFLVADGAVPLIAGAQFLESVFLLKMLTPLIVLYSIHQFWTMQVVFSRRGDRSLLVINLIGFFSMLLFSAVLIPIFKATGAVAAQLITYTILVSISYFYGKKLYSMKKVLMDNFRVIVASLVMTLALYKFAVQTWMDLVLKICAGILVYAVMLLVLKHQLVRKILKLS